MAVAAVVIFFMGWYIPPPLAHSRPVVSSPWNNTISFSGALAPVEVVAKSGQICRSHRGLHRNKGVTMLPRCDSLDRTAIVLMPHL
jgi:hypothetical protein